MAVFVQLIAPIALGPAVWELLWGQEGREFKSPSAPQLTVGRFSGTNPDRYRAPQTGSHLPPVFGGRAPEAMRTSPPESAVGPKTPPLAGRVAFLVPQPPWWVPIT